MTNTSRLRNPTKSVVSAVLKLTSATREGSDCTLTLRESGALLTHLRWAISGALSAEASTRGRCAICEAGLTSDRSLLVEAAKALRHIHYCGQCGEDSWDACGDGGRHAQLTLDTIETTLALVEAVDAVDPVAGVTTE